MRERCDRRSEVRDARHGSNRSMCTSMILVIASRLPARSAKARCAGEIALKPASDNGLVCAPKRPPEHRPRTSGAPISPHTPTPEFSYSLTLLRLRCFGSWAWILVCVGRWVAAGFWQPAQVSERAERLDGPGESVTGAIALPWALRGLGAFRERHKVMWRDRQFCSMRRVASTVGTIEPLRPREHP